MARMKSFERGKQNNTILDEQPTLNVHMQQVSRSPKMMINAKSSFIQTQRQTPLNTSFLLGSNESSFLRQILV